MKFIFLGFLFLSQILNATPVKTAALVKPAEAVAAKTDSAATVNLNAGNGKVQFEAVGRPAMVKIKGTGAGPQGNLTVLEGKVSGELKFALATLETGIDLRNEHMKEKYLEVKNYPEARLTLKDVPLPEGYTLASPKSGEGAFTGTLELHGVKKDISGTFATTEKNSVEAKFEIKISDFKIEIPSYLGVTVADTVKVQVVLNDISK